MAAPLFTIVLAAASLGGGIDGAQTAYMRCLDAELNVAVARRVDSDAFASGARRVCEEETALYRRMAVASMMGQGMAGGPAAAAERFEAFDRGNRAELVDTFEQRMKMRRGPARISGLAGERRVQRD